MNRIYLAVLTKPILTIVISALLLGCAGSAPSGKGESSLLPGPTNLEVVPKDRSLLLRWKVDRSQQTVFSGYNIYILERSTRINETPNPDLKAITPYNQVPYPGDTDGDPSKETFEAEGLQNGTRYYCMVRAVGTQGQLGAPSAEIMAVCRTGGAITMEPMFKGDRDGFDFSAPGYVDADDAECDLAMYLKDGDVRIISASRIDPLLRDTRLWNAGSADGFDRLLEFATDGSGDIELNARVNESYVFQTADGNFGKFKITRLNRNTNPATIELTYVHQSIPNLMLLR